MQDSVRHAAYFYTSFPWDWDSQCRGVSSVFCPWRSVSCYSNTCRFTVSWFRTRFTIYHVRCLVFIFQRENFCFTPVSATYLLQLSAHCELGFTSVTCDALSHCGLGFPSITCDALSLFVSTSQAPLRSIWDRTMNLFMKLRWESEEISVSILWLTS
jgi:hypothetical protein